MDDVYAQLLAEQYDDVYAVLRDPSGDVGFYVELARRTGGPVLELGCGTGRVLLPIARAGIACVGVDASASMLEVLRRKRPPRNLRLIEARMESLDLGRRRFRLITSPFRALSHLLDVEAQLAALERVHRHLAKDGLFAFDLFDPKLDRIAMPEEPEQLAARFRRDGHELRRWDSVRRDHSRQVMSLRCRFEGPLPEHAGVAEVRLRWFYRFEIEHLLARAGFEIAEIFGGFDRRPWSAGSETVVVARKAIKRGR